MRVGGWVGIYFVCICVNMCEFHNVSVCVCMYVYEWLCLFVYVCLCMQKSCNWYVSILSLLIMAIYLLI